MIDMTREKANIVARTLQDIDDFELFMDEIEKVIVNFEGDVNFFYEKQMLPAMQAELTRRKSVLEGL